MVDWEIFMLASEPSMKFITGCKKHERVWKLVLLTNVLLQVHFKANVPAAFAPKVLLVKPVFLLLTTNGFLHLLVCLCDFPRRQ